ncbi:MAG: serine/threonine-protein phosphatase [Flavobacteriales bacterium]|nr:serine/threonine-protein phosphatase [Flavobacteriales bacterium]
MILYGTLFVLVAALIGVAHLYEVRGQRQEVLLRLGTITSGLADQIPARHVQSLLEKYDSRGMLIKSTQDARYYVMHEHLRKAAERNELGMPLQVLAYDSLKQELEVIATSEEQPAFRTPFAGPVGTVLAAYNEGGWFSSEGQLIAFSSLKDEHGHSRGVIMAALPIAHADAAAYAALYRNISIALLLFVLAGVVLFRYVGRWVQESEADRIALAWRNMDITGSIADAGKIQRALVPPASAYKALLTGAFITDRPTAVVSGDFHWCHRIGNDECFVAAGDATGHGLPGAMMAAIGCSLLNEIVPNNNDREPAELLALMNERLIATLHQRGRKRGAGDGMDLALLRIDRHQREILFAGASRPLYWLHNGQLTVINGDRKPIGGAHQEMQRSYTGHRLSYAPGDRIYLFSDGYVDQFGGPERKRFMADRLQQLIEANKAEPLERQAELLERAFLEWKGSEEQVDDVCLLGIAV